MDAQKNLTNLLEIEILADGINYQGKRLHRKTTPFKVLNALYILTESNRKKGNEFTYPGKELIAKVAKCNRRQVTDFITSDACKEFCEVKHRKKGDGRFDSNVYFLKEWVYQWFKLFYRCGMMRGYLESYKAWLLTFKKRMKNFILPLVESGLSISQIYQGVLNKLSTKMMLKGATVNPLKGAGIKSLERSLNLRDPEAGFFSAQEEEKRAKTLDQELYGFNLTGSQVSWLKDTYYLNEIREAVIIRRQWEDNNFKPKSPIAAMIAAIKKVEVRQ